MSFLDLATEYGKIDDNVSDLREKQRKFKDNILTHMLRYKKQMEVVGDWEFMVKPKTKRRALNIKNLGQFAEAYNTQCGRGLQIPDTNEFVQFVKRQLKEPSEDQASDSQNAEAEPSSEKPTKKLTKDKDCVLKAKRKRRE